jgi:hypothetical protein
VINLNLFIQQVEWPKLNLAYTIATNYKSAYEQVERYLTLANKDIKEAKLYHAEIRTMNAKIVFLYTLALDEVEMFNKSEIQILPVEASHYLYIKVDKEYYQDILFGNQKLQDSFNKEIEDYCKLHNVSQYMPAFPYLAHSTDGKEELFFPIKKNMD